MLKTVSSITNAIGALNFKGTWNAATNTPTIVSGVGVKGDYFVVSVAGSTTIDGISNWGIGDWIAYNGNVWQRVEGGADLNGVNLTVTNTTTLSGLTASTALALDASKNVVSVTNTGTGDNVLATSPTLVTPILGTPSSGTVTNLTGTASININGTVGATTPATGAFTTLSATGVTTVQAGTAALPAITTIGDTNTGIYFPAADTIAFTEGGAEAVRIDSSGNLLVGTTSGSSNIIGKNTGDVVSPVLTIGTNGDGFTGSAFFGINNVGFASSNAGAAPIRVGSNTTGRSINAAGTINASGTDYAEYMTKADNFTIAKGNICGVNANGKLTNSFTDAVAFVVKSTNPSYVGGDSWGNDQAIGLRPITPTQRAAEVDEENNETQAAETDEDFASRQAQYETDLAEFEAKLEAERQKVDRIAFSGQVPVNVTGTTAGQYIVPVENNGGITGVAVNEADMTLAQYMKAVGKVIAIEDDGRARIIVKVA